MPDEVLAYVPRDEWARLPRYARDPAGRRVPFRGVIGRRPDGVILLGCPVEQLRAHRSGLRKLFVALLDVLLLIFTLWI